MTHGIHHITAIASDAQANFDFYTKTLGLRLVKKTVNQDDTKTYHLFFGDKLGHAGMDLTFFIFLPSQQGKRGNGLVTKISLAVPADSLEFWKKRFETLEVKHEVITERFGLKRLVFYDSDDQQLELVGVDKQDLDPEANIWTTDEIKADHAIRHFHSASLSVHHLGLIDFVLTEVFGYKKEANDANNTLFKLATGKRAVYLEVIDDMAANFGMNTAGTVHHIAFRATDESMQAEMKAKVLKLGIAATEVIDRFYFKSVYFRTPAGILFEIATDEPGFTADESEAELGKHLALPPFLENHRAQIEAELTPINQA
ncbi:MAG: ring-cleaving dioxygenase [Weeksellaceae bacterium]